MFPKSRREQGIVFINVISKHLNYNQPLIFRLLLFFPVLKKRASHQVFADVSMTADPKLAVEKNCTGFSTVILKMFTWRQRLFFCFLLVTHLLVSSLPKVLSPLV